MGHCNTSRVISAWFVEWEDDIYLCRIGNISIAQRLLTSNDASVALSDPRSTDRVFCDYCCQPTSFNTVENIPTGRTQPIVASCTQSNSVRLSWPHSFVTYLRMQGLILSSLKVEYELEYIWFLLRNISVFHGIPSYARSEHASLMLLSIFLLRGCSVAHHSYMPSFSTVLHGNLNVRIVSSFVHSLLLSTSGMGSLTVYI